MRKYQQFLADYRLSLMEKWADGNYQRDDPMYYVAADTDAVARAQAFADQIDMSYDFIESFYDPSKARAAEETGYGSDDDSEPLSDY